MTQEFRSSGRSSRRKVGPAVARLAAGAAVLAAAGSLGLSAAPDAAADVQNQGTNDTAKYDDNYKAVFKHTGPEGETMRVYDYATDGHAAYVYVSMWKERGDPYPPTHKDSDKLVVKNGYHNFNLREGDSGSYDIPEGHLVTFQVCKGAKNSTESNCSKVVGAHA